VVVEGGSFGYVFHKAIGVRRYRLEVTTKGGHSWGDFGRPNAIHVLSSLIEDIGKIPLPNNPKTTYNVGVIEGGISVNSIASSAHCLLDLRSISSLVLDQLVGDVESLVSKSSTKNEFQVSLTKIGHRQAGEIPRQKPPVTWAAEALRFVGCNQISFMAGSTDANVPISLGIPSVCIGLAMSGNTHRQDEYLDPTHLSHGMSQLLLLTLAAAGLNQSD
jgi:acetylornithine deacetylase/succinyl-diaminopimelate desuccinylase-like protein